MGNVYSNTDIRGHADDAATKEHIWNAGKALAEWLPEEGMVVVVATDAADANYIHTFTEGVLLQGRNVIDAGTGDQQTVVSLIGDMNAAGDALIDHDQMQNLAIVTLYDDRGVTVTEDTGLFEIGALIDGGNFVPAAEKGEIQKPS